MKVVFLPQHLRKALVHALGEIGELIESGRFSLLVAQTFPLAEVAEAHRVSEQGHVRGKLVLLVG
jgi:NADPH:quinone reductase-like Zn-dependent oxidoreductase